MKTKYIEKTNEPEWLYPHDLKSGKYYQVIEPRHCRGAIVLTSDMSNLDENRVGIVIHSPADTPWMFLARDTMQRDEYRFIEVEHGEVTHTW